MRPTLTALIAAPIAALTLGLSLSLSLSLSLPGMATAQTGAGDMAVAATDAGDADMEMVDPLEPRDARDLTLADFQWVARPIIIFADTPNDPRVAEQLQLLADRPQPLLDRDVVILVDTDPDARSAIRLQLRPRGFALVVMQKDGAIGFRRPSPRDVREIIRGIDNFALRQEEIRMGQ